MSFLCLVVILILCGNLFARVNNIIISGTLIDENGLPIEKKKLYLFKYVDIGRLFQSETVRRATPFDITNSDGKFKINSHIFANESTSKDQLKKDVFNKMFKEAMKPDVFTDQVFVNQGGVKPPESILNLLKNIYEATIEQNANSSQKEQFDALIEAHADSMR